MEMFYERNTPSEYLGLRDSLERGEVVDFYGILLRKDNSELEVGDLYIGERNTTKLLTVESFNEDKTVVFNTIHDYPFNIGKCTKVRKA